MEIENQKKRKRQALPISIKFEEFIGLMKKTRQKDLQTKVAFLLGFGAGMRISEIKNLQKQDVDIKAKRIHIKSGKYSKDRIVPLPKGFSDKHLRSIPIKKTMRSMQRNFKVAAKKAGLRDELHFHSLRHGFATRLIEKGVPINQVQLMLGHSNVATTSVYIRANPEDALKSYEDLF